MRPRERVLAGVVALLAGGWLVNSILVEPVSTWLGDIAQRTTRLQRDIDEATVLIDRQQRILTEWRGRHAAGLLDDEAGARFRAQALIAGSAKSSGFTVGSLGGGQLVTAGADQIYDLVRLTISGHGNLGQVQSFVAGIETAAMPLRIERCELAASDPKQDQIDVSMTVSTCILAEKARAGRGVPEGTTSWQPVAVDRSWDRETLMARPFLSDRSRPVVKETPVEVTPVAMPVTGWVVVGVVVGTEANQAVAFARSLSGGSERELRVGDRLDDRQVQAITSGGVTLAGVASEDGASATEPQLIAVGSDLSGKQVATATTARMSTPTVRSSTSTTTTTPISPASGGTTASPFQIPAVTGDPDREAILERLRQQRNRKQ